MHKKQTQKIIFSALLFFSVLCSAQQRKIDSLQNVLTKNIADTEKVKTYNALHAAYAHTGRNKEALDYSTKALLLSQKLNFIEGELVSYNQIGNIYDLQGKYADAIKIYNQAINTAVQSKKTKKLDGFYLNLGNVYMEQGNFDEGVKNYKLALQYATELGAKADKAIICGNIGGAFFEQANYVEAEKYFLMGKTFAEATGDKRQIGASYYMLSAVYSIQNNNKAAVESLKKALEIQKETNDLQAMIGSYTNLGVVYRAMADDSNAIKSYRTALTLAIQFNDKRGLAGCYLHIGELYDGEKNYEKALTNFNMSSAICVEIGDQTGLSSLYNAQAALFLKMNKPKDALDYYSKAMTLSGKINSQSDLQESYSGLADTYNVLKDYKQAFDYFKLYSTLKDTILNQENNKQINKMNIAYESDKKDKEIEILNKDRQLRTADLNHQKIITRSAVIGITLLLFFSVLLYSRFRLTRKQKDIIELQKKMVDEKNKDITDSIHYAYRIQRALLVSENYLKKQLSEYFIFYQPKDIVSGDFYWASHTENNFLIAAGDSTGHGVPGAFMSMLGINFLNEIVLQKKQFRPDKILNELRKNIIHALNPEDAKEESQDGMDMVLCSFDFNKKELQFSASNRPLWIARKSDTEKPQLIEFKPDKFPVGKHSNDTKPFTLQTVALQKGDIVYTFSDGYVDQFGGKDGKKFKYKQLQEFLIANYHKPLEEQKEILNQLFQTWKGNLEQVDDVLVIGIKI